MRHQLATIAVVLAGCHGAHVGGSTDPQPGSTDAPAGACAVADPLDPQVAPALDTDATHYPAGVWMTDGMHKVQPTASPGAEHWADLHAAKNETESVQVHVQNPSGASRNVTVAISELADGCSGAHIGAAHVLVSREAYLDITMVSDANGTLGMTPDPLIPSIDPYVHEARAAFPVAIPPGETRSAWIDISVPADAPSGWYTGTITVTDDGGTVIATLPVRLAVWDFALPATSTLHSGFGLSWNGLCAQAYGSYSACGAYPGAAGDADRAVELTHLAEVNMLLDYHVSLAAAVYAPPDPGNWTHFDSTYGPLMSRAGSELTHLWYTGDFSNATLLGAWADHFRTRTWLDRTSVYFCDEPPNGCSWADAQARADLIHEAAPGLMTLLTTDFAHASANDLLDRVDILVPVVDSMESPTQASVRGDYDDWLAGGGKHLWWYQSCDEHESCTNGTAGPADSTWPSYMVDASPVRNRVFQWLAYLYRIEGELYYATDYCWTASCGGGGSDPWASIYAFGGNGDGTLFYPGTPEKIGGSTPVPVPSMRLALIRDGMEDYEYLHALDGIDTTSAHAAAASFITNTYTFDNDPAKLQAARLQIGTALHQRVHP